jgi:predicted nucleic acid-binding protein
MGAEWRIFLDTSVLFAAVLSERGGARELLNLGEAGSLCLVIGPRVVQESDAVISRKAPASKALFAVLLDRAGIEIGPRPDAQALARAGQIISYAPDAHVLAEAIVAQADYFVTLDRQHFAHGAFTILPFPIGTPGDCLAWLRARLSGDR